MMQYAGFRMHVGWLDLGFEIHGVRWRIFDAGRMTWFLDCGVCNVGHSLLDACV